MNIFELPPAARGSFCKNRPWTPQKLFIKVVRDVAHEHYRHKNGYKVLLF
jgi:hypothetical protein